MQVVLDGAAASSSSSSSTGARDGTHQLSVLWKVPTCAKLISLLNARAPFAKRSQDRSGRSGPWSLPRASGLEEGITALHSKGPTPVRGCLASGSLGCTGAQIPPPFSLTKRPSARQEVKQSTKRGTTLAQRQAFRCSTQYKPACAGLRWLSLALAGLCSLSVRCTVLLPDGRMDGG